MAWVGGDLQAHPAPTHPIYGPIHPGLEHLQGWGTHSSLGSSLPTGQSGGRFRAWDGLKQMEPGFDHAPLPFPGTFQSHSCGFHHSAPCCHGGTRRGEELILIPKSIMTWAGKKAQGTASPFLAAVENKRKGCSSFKARMRVHALGLCCNCEILLSYKCIHIYRQRSVSLQITD